MEEPRYGGLIDRYWFINWIVIPLIIIGIVVLFLWLIGRSCPYTEDVSSCFPYNLPDWVKLSIPLISIFTTILLVWLITGWFKAE